MADMAGAAAVTTNQTIPSMIFGDVYLILFFFCAITRVMAQKLSPSPHINCGFFFPFIQFDVIQRILPIVWNVTLQAVQMQLAGNRSESDRQKLHSALMSLKDFFNAALNNDELETSLYKVHSYRNGCHALLASIPPFSRYLCILIPGSRHPVSTSRGPKLTVLFGVGSTAVRNH